MNRPLHNAADSDRPPCADGSVVVVGGGFYGLRIAAMTALAGLDTVLVEREPRFMSRASFNNQARVHGGYHYPRSVLTAIRARSLYARFHSEFSAALGGEFRHIYAIARQQTLVGAREFAEFCRRIGAPLSPAPREVAARFDTTTIEQVFFADEGVFDAHRLADIAITAAVHAGVRCITDTEATAVEAGRHRRLRLRLTRAGETESIEADWVINASYADLNGLLVRSGLTPISLVHELAELAIVQPPPSLVGAGVTVMDGPFWSCLPFPVLHAHSLSHVRYTPHARWNSGEVGPTAPDGNRASHAMLMQRDAARFLPAMRDARYVSSLWETKTVLPRSVGDDGRPILVHRHADAVGLVSVLGGKIDSVYDVEDELRDLLLQS